MTLRVAADTALLLMITISCVRAQESRALRYGIQPGEVYQYRIEMSSTFTGGETRNRVTIRGVETLVVVERDAGTITLLPLPFGFRLTDYLVHGEGLEAYGARSHGRGDPFFGAPLRTEEPSRGIPNPFLGTVVVQFSEIGAASSEAMLPRFWGVLAPLGEWLQNYFPMTAYPWTRLPEEPVTAGQSWDLPFPGTLDTVRYTYGGRESGEIPCDVIQGSIKVSGQTAGRWGSPEGVEISSTLCLATDGGFPVTEEVRVSQPLGTVGKSEQSIRAVLIGRRGFDEETLQALRDAARDPASVRSTEPGPLRPLVGQPAPDLELRDATGSFRLLSDFAGRVVVVHFWVPWLSLSAQTLAGLRDVGSEFDSEDVELLAVVTQGEAMRGLGVAPSVLEEIDPSLPLLRPAETADLAAFHANEVAPVTVIVDRKGIVRKTFVGTLGKESLRAWLREAAAE